MWLGRVLCNGLRPASSARERAQITTRGLIESGNNILEVFGRQESLSKPNNDVKVIVVIGCYSGVIVVL